MNNIKSDYLQGKKTVNSAVRICVTCGDTGVKIDNYGIYCKNCDIKFDREEVCAC